MEESNLPIKKKVGRPKGLKNITTDFKIKNKKLFIDTLKQSYGILTPALEIAGITRQTFNKYYNTDPEFALEIDNIRESAIDFVESQLYEQIKAKNPTSTIFYLKCRARSRGYIDNVDVKVDSTSEIRIKYILPTLPEEPKDQIEVNNPITIKINDNNL